MEKQTLVNESLTSPLVERNGVKRDLLMDQTTGKIPRERSTKKRKLEYSEQPTHQELTVGDQEVTIQQGGASPTTSQSHPASAAAVSTTTKSASRTFSSSTSQIHSEGNLPPANKGRRQGGSHGLPPASNNIQYQGKVHAFPFKLHTMLEDATKQGFDSDVSWVHDGMAFKIHNRENFAKQILPRYFSQTQYKSFQVCYSCLHCAGIVVLFGEQLM